MKPLLTLFCIFLTLSACDRNSPQAPYPDPARYEVRGIDISAHNGDIDFPLVREDGYEFVMQGLNFLNSVKDRELDLPLVIDLEEWTNPNSQATALVLNRLGEMIDHLESHGYRVMLYTNKNGFARFIERRLEGYPLWICSLAVEPDKHRWTIWQATHNGRVSGTKSPVDINAFHGTMADWETFANGSKSPPATQ